MERDAYSVSTALVYNKHGVCECNFGGRRTVWFLRETGVEVFFACFMIS